MKRISIFLLILLCLTGCKVEYKINLDENFNIDESIKFTSEMSSEQEKIKEVSWNIPVEYSHKFDFVSEKKEDIDYYKLRKIENGLTYSYKYKDDMHQRYIDSTFVNLAYNYVSISKMDNGELVLSSSKDFLVFGRHEEVEEVKITIHTNYKVLSNNADKVNNHDYTWIITKDNAYGKGIYLKLDTTKEDLTFFEKLMRGDYLNIFTLALTISLIGFLVYKFFKKYSQKRDEI